MATEPYQHPAWLRRFSRKAYEDGVENISILDFIPEKVLPKIHIIQQANKILEEYAKDGFQLTLRQLYYQFVARGLIANTDKNYKLLGVAVVDGRLWGMIDWDFLVDRARVFQRKAHWDSPSDIIRSAYQSFRLDRWQRSVNRVEVWVEKQALEEVIEKACQPYDVGYIACKGYMSISEMRSAAERLNEYAECGQECTVIYLGDHDPSGIDMSRDIQDRLNMFRCRATVERIALNMDQVEQYNPPPNPAKLTDSRCQGYIERFGNESWELDALEPKVMVRLIQDTIEQYVDEEYHETVELEERQRELLRACSDRWSEVSSMLEED